MGHAMQCVFRMRSDGIAPDSVSKRSVCTKVKKCSCSVLAYESCLQAQRGNKDSAPLLGILERVNEAYSAIASAEHARIESAR
jgi:hypothetical protein